MTTQSFWAPGGFAEHRPGLAALALAVASAPLSGSPAGRAAAIGGALRSVLTPRGVRLNLWADTDTPASLKDIWAPMDPISDRAAQALDSLRRSTGRTELNDPLTRALHMVETAVWGTSRWSACWGGDEDTYSGQEISDVLISWQTGDRLPHLAEQAFAVPQLAPHPWADGPVAHQTTAMPKAAPRPSTTGRVELTLALPVVGAHSAAYAAIAAQLLGQPYTGVLFEHLRTELPLAYGIAAVPLVRGDHTALVVSVSTTPDRTAECARHVAATVRQFTAEPVPEHQLPQAVVGIRRMHNLAMERFTAAEPPTPQQRCLLEADVMRLLTSGTNLAHPTGHVPSRAVPRWAVYGEVAEPERLERVLEEAW